MKIFLTILGLLLIVVLQVTLVPFVSWWSAGPNLVLVSVLILVIAKRFEKVWWLIVLTGLFWDFLVGLPFGLVSLSLVTTACLIDQFNRNIFSGIKLWVLAVLILLGSLIFSLLVFGLGWLFQAEPGFNLIHLILEILYNLVISGLFYAGFKSKIFH